jgi:NADPH:quinone reductase-like Zn-dependent oxidoreductase
MSTMWALRAHWRGGPEALVHETAPTPDAGPGEVLVAVHAAAITFAELGWDETWTRDGRDRTPVIPSHEFSGVVAATGAGVAEPAVGQRVCGLVPFDQDGAAAEFVVVPSDWIVPVPASLPHPAAAALPLAAMTAWQAVVDHAGVAPGDDVLVHGGAGGVGAFAVQLATRLGARVTATCRTRDVAFVADLGAARVIDTDRESFDADLGPQDVVIDTVGGTTLDRSYAVMRRGGRLVTLQAPPSADLAREYGVRAMFFIVGPARSDLARLVHLAATGELRVTVGETFPLPEGRAAYLSGSRPRRPGKVVLVVRADDVTTPASSVG